MGGGDFDTILQRLKANYRHIIIDTPPILPASESLVFARAADTAILCMRRDFSRLDQSQSAFNRMTSAGVHVSGAVLNGIPTRQYAYHYGSYEFSLDA
jgi:tyrosine-protein kinase Etk/Wzc